MNLSDIIKDTVLFHTPLQSNLFILDAAGCGSVWGMYRQACREVTSRIRPLVEAYNRPESALPLIRELDYAELQEREREFLLFYQRAVGLKQLLDKLDPAEAEIDFWVCKFKKQAAVELMAGGRVSAGTLEAILSLPIEHREPLLSKLFTDPTGVMDEVRAQETLMIPAVEVPVTQVRELVCSTSLLSALA